MSNNQPAQESAKRSLSEVRRDIEHTRRELAETLDALEFKLDVPARTKEWVEARKEQFDRVREESPATVIGVAVGAVVVVGGIVAGVVGFARRGR